MPGTIEVAVGVIGNAEGRILVQKRPEDAHVGGLWEFPGGKHDPGESRAEALRRELREELGIIVEAARPLIRVNHAYPDKTVALDVWRVESWSGEMRALEDQPLRWIPPDDLPDLAMPAADVPIVNAVRLPDACLVTNDESDTADAFLARLEERLAAGIRLVQLRTRRNGRELESLCRSVAALCRRHGATLLLNGDPDLATRWGAHGVHLNGERLRAFRKRPVPTDCWLSAACHDGHELDLAHGLDVDFVLASPVAPTASHPERRPLGWDGFADLCAKARVPVYALGGMKPEDRQAAWQAGGQGVAGIGGLW